ncbi:MAG: trypsin-like peptidase domain-containing protein, partial [Gemmatimonadales bacterium]
KRNQRVMFSRDEIIVSAEHADITYSDGRYVLRDHNSRNGTFVNWERILQKTLETGDIIEFGRGGPSAQFVTDTEEAMIPTLDLAEKGTPDSLRKLPTPQTNVPDSTTTGVRRRFPSTRDFVSLVQRNKRRAFINTIGLVALLAVISGVAFWQIRQRGALQDSLADFALTLDAERGTRSVLERNLTDIQVRYDSLLKAVEATDRERRAAEAAAMRNVSTRNVAARLSGGVGLIVYSYGFTRTGTKELLRYRTDAQNMPLTRFNSQGRIVPEVDFGGGGPPVQRQGSATGFLVDSTGWVITNRHVAQPWSQDDGLQGLRMQGWDVEPQFITLQIYFPPGDQSYPLRVVAVSDQVDLSVMRTSSRQIKAPILPLSTEDRLIPPGEHIAFIGYPTGVHNLLFRVADDRRKEILSRIGEEPVDLARELARLGQIQPLVTSGDISDTTDTEIIHTAAATGGGSGGPLIATSGRVVAIHYAAVRSPIRGDPVQTQRGVRAGFAWELLPVWLRNKLRR